MLVPSLHFKNANPKIDFKDSPFYVNTETKEWENDKYPLRAGVTSLGVGGTNAHAVLEEAPRIELSLVNRDTELFLISGKTASALENNTNNLKEYFSKNINANVADIAYTLKIGREHFNYRRIFVLNNVRESIKDIDSKANIKSNFINNTNKNIVFMFSGQGSQYVNMGRGLYERELYFRENIDKCSELLKKRLGFDIREILFAGDDLKNQNESIINQVLYTQPIKFVFEYSLAKLLIKLGVTPNYLIGHSFGEIGVACLSGVFSLEDALEVVALRGELMESIEPGLMVSVNMTEELVNKYISKCCDISLAAVNGKELCIVSGKTKDILEFEQAVNKDGFDSLILKVPRAAHSNMMIPIMEKFRQGISQMKLNEPKIPYISGLSGDWIKKEEATSDRYWSRHLKETIKFSNGISKLLSKGDSVFVQLGPDRGLVSFVELNEEKRKSDSAINLIRHKNELIDDNEYFSNQIGELWLNGVEIDWTKYYEGERRFKVSLPTYEFDKHKFESKVNLGESIDKVIGTNNRIEINKNIEDWFYLPTWEQSPQIEKNIFEGSNNWLVFLDALGIGDSLERTLVAENQNVIKVSSGDSFKKVNDFEFIINHINPLDYESLFRELKNKNTIPHKILYLFNVTNNDDYENIYDKALKARCLGLYGLINIAQSIGELKIENNVTIYSVTNNLNSVLGTELLNPEKSTVLGAVKVIPLEYPNIKCRNIDVENNEIEKAANNILRETCIETSNRLVAYRNDIRWSERIRPIKIDNISTKRCKKNGVYLIIGGMGGVGLSIAEYLGKEYQAKLILVGRTSFLDKELWDNWLIEKGNNDEISKKILKIREIEFAGGTIDILHGDVINYSEMEEIVKYILNNYSSINGVIHAAMTVDRAGLIQNRKKVDNEKVMNSKIDGTINLYRLFENKNIDFMMFCSSLTGVIGNPGEIGYVAANEFIGYFASVMNKRSSTFITAIDWNGWLEVGAGIKVVKESLKVRNIKINEINYNDLLPNFINPKEGIEIFKIVMGNYFSRVTISKRDIEEEINKNVVQEFILEASDNTLKAESYPRPDLNNNYVEPETEIEKRIAELWSAFFRYEKIGIFDDFFELGGDSLKAMRLFAILHKEFNVRIGVKEIFKRPTISLISEYIGDNLEEVII
jgi:acyl transferase domain-containing protein/acyl carrier protein